MICARQEKCSASQYYTKTDPYSTQGYFCITTPGNKHERHITSFSWPLLDYLSPRLRHSRDSPIDLPNTLVSNITWQRITISGILSYHRIELTLTLCMVWRNISKDSASGPVGFQPNFVCVEVRILTQSLNTLRCEMTSAAALLSSVVHTLRIDRSQWPRAANHDLTTNITPVAWTATYKLMTYPSCCES